MRWDTLNIALGSIFIPFSEYYNLSWWFFIWLICLHIIFILLLLYLIFNRNTRKKFLPKNSSEVSLITRLSGKAWGPITQLVSCIKYSEMIVNVKDIKSKIHRSDDKKNKNNKIYTYWYECRFGEITNFKKWSIMEGGGDEGKL